LITLDPYQSFIHKSRYARWVDSKNRRETWEETVSRYVEFFSKKCPQIDAATMEEVREAILNLEVLPSMRALMTAGKALERDNVAGYGCAYAAVDHPRIFDEIMYILMNGTGVGFSVDRAAVNQMPPVPDEFFKTDTTIVVKDSKIGWASSFRELISLLYAGQIPTWDVSQVRPAGARLKTFGGRASGPEPLVKLFKFVIEVFQKAAGRKLTSLECHDICCKIADVVVVGGVRRSALLSLSNLSDDRMRGAKSGQWWLLNPQRGLANNSAIYTEKPEPGIFMKEWLSLYESKSGERGIFNRMSAKRSATLSGRRDPNHDFGANPCVEINLRPNQFCNLTEVVIRPWDTVESLAKKIRIATIMGTMQATLTNFRYLRAIWKKNVEEERLLGVSLTGIADNTLTNGKQGHDVLADALDTLKTYAIEVNAEFAALLGINPAAAITTVKPSGTGSQLVDSGSGIHAWHSAEFIRRVRGDKKDPLSKMLFMEGIPAEDDAMKPNDMWVFSFPRKAPEDAVLRNDRTALEQLEMYLTYKENWTDHNVSITVSVRENEWLAVGAWVYDHFDQVGGISFLPYDGGSYVQAPYEEITKAQYEALLAKMPVIDWDRLPLYETEDGTTSSHELACAAGGCELR